MIDPLTSLGFSVYSNKGVYALLLGSGISRSAGIPTGWDIVLDLIRKVAHLQSAICEPDPATWYRETFGIEPGYADILDKIAGTQTERNQLLRRYFEPTDEEREEGRKVPTAAHHAIARLVAVGFIRVIVTTNFDRLMEQALEAAGVVPTVISTPDAIDGALPLVHTAFTIVKVHGDYMDVRIRNTPEELASYDDRSNRLLDRIFDEYGLIVCGWSADWDEALLSAIRRCPNRRFSTYWAAVGSLGTNAQSIISLRSAVHIPIEGADSFFTEVAEKVVSLDELRASHPMSPAIAAATLKRYLGKGEKIRLHDFVMQEAEALQKRQAEPDFDLRAPFSVEELNLRLKRYESATQTLLQVIINGCYWGEQDEQGLWVQCFERVHGTRIYSGDERWQLLMSVPALLIFYAGAIASMAAGKYGTLTDLVKKGKVIDNGTLRLLTECLYPEYILDKNKIMAYVPGYEHTYSPGSVFLWNALKQPLASFFSNETEYDNTFDRFEYLFALYIADKNMRENRPAWGPIGRDGFISVLFPRGKRQIEVYNEVMAQRADWPPFVSGLFGQRKENAVQDFLEVKTLYDQFVSTQSRL